MINQENEHRCNNCAAALGGQPEYEHSEWFLRCSSCGAKNLLTLKVTIIGCRRMRSPALVEPTLSRIQLSGSVEHG